jgi:hypothetical protein
MGYEIDPATGKPTFNNSPSTVSDLQKGSDWTEQRTQASVASVAALEDVPYQYDGMTRSVAGVVYIRLTGGEWKKLVDVDDTGWIEPTLGANWAVNSVTPAYRMKNGMVAHRGRANRTAGTAPAYEIPEGFWPDETMVVGLDANGATIRSQVTAAGAVGPVGSAVVTALAFDGIPPYFAAQP